MCDRLIAPPASTAERVMIFGKNSDRQHNEAQAVERHAAATHAPGAELACTYISIPQARETQAILLSRPFWMWGGEMGANAAGVVIGNEALHARTPGPEEPALIGMDLLRLGLERASTAAEAVRVITTLLERHGQGGNCGHLTPFHYNNGFMVADPDEAFVLETVGRDWVVERVASVRTMSNAYSVGRAPEARSAGLDGLIQGAGWGDGPSLDYAAAIQAPDREHIGNPGARRARSTASLVAEDGAITTETMMRALRDHGPTNPAGEAWRPSATAIRTVCMHAGEGDRRGQTVGAMVSEIRHATPLHWVTGTAAPCLSVFKPVLMDVALPDMGPPPSDRYDSTTLWWRHERLHRSGLLGDFAGAVAGIAPERDALEDRFRARMAAALASHDTRAKADAVAACWREAAEAEDRWLDAMPPVPPPATPYTRAWSDLNRLAGLDLGEALPA